MTSSKSSGPIVINKTLVDSTNKPGKYRDSKLTGFVLRITPAGTKTYCIDTRVKGTRERVTVAIGIHGKDGMTAEKARKEADNLISKYIKQGLNPHGEREKAKEAQEKVKAAKLAEEKTREITLQSTLEGYLADQNLKDSTKYNYSCVIRANLKDWLNKPLVEITRDMVIHRYAQLCKKTHVLKGNTVEKVGEANNTMRVLRLLFEYTINNYENKNGEPLIKSNPVKGLSQKKKWKRLERRERYIEPHELKAWYRAIYRLNNKIIRDYLLFVLFTGLRKEEAASLQWHDVDLLSKKITIEDTKNHQRHILPLSDYLYTLLEERLKYRESDYVFPGRSTAGYLRDPREQISRVVEESGVEFTIHDLRRTFITTADDLGIGYYTIKKLANHKAAADVTAGYVGGGTERLRSPMQRIADCLIEHAGIKQNNKPQKKLLPFGKKRVVK